MKLKACKSIEFAYAHYLPNHPGRCSNLHGHNAKLEVTVSRRDPHPIDKNGMVVDFGDLKEIMNTVADAMDHSYINKLNTDNLISNDLANSYLFQLKQTPTAENMVLFFWYFLRDELYRRDEGVVLERIRLWETTNSYVEMEL